MFQASTTSELQFVLNYPLIIFIVAIVAFLLYRYLNRLRDESARDDGWLDDASANNQ